MATPIKPDNIDVLVLMRFGFPDLEHGECWS
jgi:hypothetical protein